MTDTLTATRTYPRATLTRLTDRRWRTDDGYSVVKRIHDDGWCDFHVHTPGGAERAVCALMREAREAICALRATGGEYAHPWLAYLRSN